MNMDYILVLHLNIIQYHLFHIKIEDISSSLATSNQIYRVALHRSVNRLIQANVSSMRPSPSNPGSAQQFKPLFVQLPGLIIRQAEKVQTQDKCYSTSSCTASVPFAAKRAGSILPFSGCRTDDLWIQVWVLSSDIGFKLGLTLFTHFPLCRDPNITRAIPGGRIYKQSKW